MVTVNREEYVDSEYQLFKALRETGGMLTDLPFIPQDYGFKETVNEEEGIIIARIYSKDNFHLARYIASKSGEWGIRTPSGHDVRIRLSNRRNAVVILKALGMNIDFYPEK